MTGAGRAIKNQVNELGGLKSGLLGVVGAYATARGAASLFKNTIGEAMKFEASTVAVDAIFNDKAASTAYMEMVDKMAIDSPLLNSTDMLANSKGLVAMTKNLDELGKSWSIVEKLQVLDPTQGTDGATFALKEMFQGDALSMVERFGLNKKELNRIKKLAIPQQIAEINAMLDDMGVTEAAINKMGQTTLGYWAQIGERADKFKRILGESSNSKIGEVLGGIVKKLDSMDLDALARKFDAVVGNGMQKIIDFGKAIWSARKPILAVAKVVGTFAVSIGGIILAVKSIGAIGAVFAFLASPIGLAAAAITGLVLGFQALYKHSEPFRAAIDGVVGVVKGFMSAMDGEYKNAHDIMAKAGLSPEAASRVMQFARGVKDAVADVQGAFEAMSTMSPVDIAKALGLSDETIAQITGTIDTVKASFESIGQTFSSLFEAVQPGIESILGALSGFGATIVDVFVTLWGLLGPIFSGIATAFGIIGEAATIVFTNVIVPAVDLVIWAFQTLWNVAGPILELLGAAIELAFTMLQIMWDTVISPFIGFLTGEFATAVEKTTGSVDSIGAAFEFVGGIISTVAGYVKDFAGALANVKVPDWIGSIGGKIKSAGNAVNNFLGIGGPPKSRYHGQDRVPYDGYMIRAHRGERLLTRQQADMMDAMSPQLSNVIQFPRVASLDFDEKKSDGLDERYSYEGLSGGDTYNTTTTSVTNNTTAGNESSGRTPASLTVIYQGGQKLDEDEMYRFADFLAVNIISAQEAGA
ncbi:phage tail protein [Sporosarcina obsidiansis]|uniref:phage tail protein n=1 Tax=Sporosarcina obsidiansis TaxID=2660748 RepID=UPI00129A4FFA|nr:hypothetical protein [Sporosarcina obsidiansis]